MAEVTTQYTQTSNGRDILVYDDGEVTTVDGQAIPQAKVNYYDDGTVHVDIPGNNEVSFSQGLRGAQFDKLKASNRQNVFRVGTKP